MKYSALLIALFLTIIYLPTFSQNNESISIKEINTNIDKLSASLKKDGYIDNMFIKIDNDGIRWIQIENTTLDGLPSDEKKLGCDFSKVVMNMLYKSIIYNLEKPFTFQVFLSILEDKNIYGVKFKSKNNDLFLNWKMLYELK